ncbi:MlaD family protein, partial [Glaciimonas sp. CA11.2]
MTEEKENPSLPDLPTPRMKRQRNWLPSLVWLIPIVAALVGLTLVAKIIVERGPVITVTFITAEGLEAGKTKVKYKDVDIGTVEKITLSKDHSHIIATIQLLKEAKSFTAMDARFWVVRP